MTWPTKQIVPPYTVTPADLGYVLVATAAGDIILPMILNLAARRFSAMVLNQSSGTVLVKTQGNRLHVHGATAGSASLIVPSAHVALVSAFDGSSEWLGMDVSGVFPAVTSVLKWGPSGSENLNGGAIFANPTLTVGVPVSFALAITNPSGSPVALTNIVEAYVNCTGSDFTGSFPTIAPLGTNTFVGSMTPTGTVGASGSMSFTLTDAFGIDVHANIPFVIGAAPPVGSPPVGSPPVGSPPVGK